MINSILLAKQGGEKMATKLIIIEGLPGSGKSTAAQKVYDILKAKGINVEL